MITILISGPQGSGKTQIAKHILQQLRRWNFVNFEVYTTNVPLEIPANSTKEQE
jgi:uridine kinase